LIAFFHFFFLHQHILGCTACAWMQFSFINVITIASFELAKMHNI
jgi:hypothetical protein